MGEEGGEGEGLCCDGSVVLVSLVGGVGIGVVGELRLAVAWEVVEQDAVLAGGE